MHCRGTPVLPTATVLPDLTYGEDRPLGAPRVFVTLFKNASDRGELVISYRRPLCYIIKYAEQEGFKGTGCPLL